MTPEALAQEIVTRAKRWRVGSVAKTIAECCGLQCGWCFWETRFDDREGLAEHIMTCGASPLVQALNETEDARDRLAEEVLARRGEVDGLMVAVDVARTEVEQLRARLVATGEAWNEATR